jgi:uncharacterized protein YuzE
MASTSVTIRLEAVRGAVPRMPFRWDPETEILAGRFSPPKGDGFTGSIEFEGAEGAFVLLDVEGGTVCGVEVVVWPEVEEQRLTPPDDAEAARLVLPVGPVASGVGALEVETEVECFATADERTFHFLLGDDRDVDVVRLADTLLVEVDDDGVIAGLWLLDVPPFRGAQ